MNYIQPIGIKRKKEVKKYNRIEHQEKYPKSQIVKLTRAQRIRRVAIKREHLEERERHKEKI
jgi:hypothetical protein